MCMHIVEVLLYWLVTNSGDHLKLSGGYLKLSGGHLKLSGGWSRPLWTHPCSIILLYHSKINTFATTYILCRF